MATLDSAPGGQKTTYYSGDRLLISDQEDAGDSKYIETDVILTEARDKTGLTEKTTITDNDIVEINDSAASNVPKKVKHSTIKSNIQNVNALTEKTTISDNDTFLINDSAASNVPKKVKHSTIRWYDTVVSYADTRSTSAIFTLTDQTIAYPSGYTQANTVIVGTRISRTGTTGRYQKITDFGTETYNIRFSGSWDNAVSVSETMTFYFYLKKV